MEERSVEVSAASVDEAIAKALAHLGASRDEVEVEVLDKGSRGLLGLGATEAKVLVTLRPPKAVAEAVEPGLSYEEKIGQLGKEVLENLLAGMRVKAEVSISRGKGTPGDEERGPVMLNITGRDLGLLIGRQGQTLRTLQYITRLIVSRRTQRWANLVVDVERYKERRRRALESLAHRMADRAVADQRPVALEPMPAHERRIVHLALRDHPAVTTESVGEGEKRRVTIRPKV